MYLLLVLHQLTKAKRRSQDVYGTQMIFVILMKGEWEEVCLNQNANIPFLPTFREMYSDKRSKN